MSDMTKTLEVLGYELARIDNQLTAAGAQPNVMDWMDTAQCLAGDLNLAGRPLPETYPGVVRLCAVLMKIIEAMPPPEEIADLVGYEGLTEPS